MTPHELNLHIETYVERLTREDENSLVQAYLTAYWHRVKRMPNLKSLLNKPKKPLSDAQLLAQIKAINASMGGQVRERGRESSQS